MRVCWSLSFAALVGCRFGFDARTGDGIDATLPATDASADGFAGVPSEFYPPGANLRSIGTSGTTFNSIGSVEAGSTAVTLQDSLAPASGPGDQLIIGGEVLYIRQVDSPIAVTVQAPAAASHVMDVVSIRRAFASPQAWETARGGDLVATDRLELGLLYRDSPFLSAGGNILDIDGSITDATHYMHLTVGPGQRHTGGAGTGVVFDGGHQSDGIRVRDPFTRIDGIELRGFSGETITWYSVHVEADNTLLNGLLIHDFKSTASTAYGVMVIDAPGDYVVRNTFVYDGDTAFRVSHPAGLGTVENCTVRGVQRSGVRLTEGAMTARNVIAVGNGATDFRDELGTMIQSNNISSDASAGGAASLTGVSSAGLLVSPTDLHQLPGSAAQDAGATLGFCCDIDGDVRPAGPAWDVGADER